MSLKPAKSFKSHAKLMVSGEYVVLKGALSLALPLQFGQKLTVSEIDGTPSVLWKSMINNDLWFYTTLLLPDLQILDTNRVDLSETLQKTLKAAKVLNPHFLESNNIFQATSNMNFNPDWGVGSSSSFISNIAYWADCDPFELNNLIFTGSGYDIACARSSVPIIFERKGDQPHYREAKFSPVFNRQLFFIYLNQMQNSKESIGKLKLSKITKEDIQMITKITLQLENAEHLNLFQILMEQHEAIIAKIIGEIPIKVLKFKDFDGSVKSLGAWGGDFILAASTASEEYVRNYFISNGLNTIFRYDEIVSDENLKFYPSADGN
ncbi:MAG: GYDIA family GHMP kinase [Mariniphaga sp.]